MENNKLRVLIVSNFGAHQKAIQAMCASIPQISDVYSVADTNQALEMVKTNLPDLMILGANLAESKVIEFLSRVTSMPFPPYCITLTLSDNDKSFDQNQCAGQIVSTRSFAVKLPEILSEVYAI